MLKHQRTSPQPRVVRVGLVQHTASGSKSENVERAVLGLREAAARGAELICLQELFASPYFPQVEDSRFFDWAEPIEGPTVQTIATLAKELKVSVLTGIFERRAPGLYHNSLVVLGPRGDTLGLYRKMHIPDDPQFMEKYYFAPGDLGFMSVDTPHGKVGTLICWDQWFPEAARLTALSGAEILFYPTAIGWLADEKANLGTAQLDSWRTIQRSHAIANGVYTAAVNRVGVETSEAGQIEFWGNSFVCAPDGQLVASAGLAEEVLVVPCDLAEIETQRQAWPFLRDRRADAYSDLTKRWGR